MGSIFSLNSSELDRTEATKSMIAVLSEAVNRRSTALMKPVTASAA